MSTLTAVSMFLPFGFGRDAVAAVDITWSAGGVVVPQVTGDAVSGWVVILQARGNPSVQVFLRVTGPNERINSIQVIPMDPSPLPSTSHNITLHIGVQPQVGSVGYLGSISNENPVRGDLWLGQVLVAGTVGDPASPNSTAITAQSIGTVRSGGGIGSSIASLGSSQVGGAVVQVEATSGSITGNIAANAGIDNIICEQGTLGPAAGLSTVTARLGISTIRAKSIRSNIDASFGTLGGDVAVVRALGPAASGGVGDFVGSLHAVSLGPRNTPNAVVRVAGDLDADLTFERDIDDANGAGEPAAIVVGGAFKAGRRIQAGWGMQGGAATVGGIKIDTTGGLQGQVIVNAANAGFTWAGDVLVGAGAGQVLLDPQAAAGAYYAATSASLGGGSVGLVPFHLHDLDCSPPLAGALSSRTMLMSEFCHQTYGSGECPPTPDLGGPIAPKTVVLRAYGPIRAESATLPPVTIRLYDPSTGTYSPTPFEDYLTITLASPSGSTLKTQIEVRGLSTQNLIEGEYHIRPKLTGSARLLCDGLTTTANVPFGEDFTYSFKLLTDCNRNGQWDASDIDQVPSLDIFGEDMVGPNGKIDCCEPCYPDYNEDGNVDQDDVTYLTNVIAGGSNPTNHDPDFNRDGNVDQDDVADLINTVGGGGCP